MLDTLTVVPVLLYPLLAEIPSVDGRCMAQSGQADADQVPLIRLCEKQ